MAFKEELKDLNCRLAAYVDRVKYLENEKHNLELKLESCTMIMSKTESITALYQEEIAELRKTLDITAEQKAKLGVSLIDFVEKLDVVKGKLKEANDRLCQRDKEVADVLEKLNTLKLHCQQQENCIVQVKYEKKKLEELFMDSEKERTRQENRIKEKEATLEKEVLKRVNFENEKTTLREIISFKESIDEKEYEVKSLNNSEVLDFTKNYSSNVIIEELKTHYEEKIKEEQIKVSNRLKELENLLKEIVDDAGKKIQSKDEEISLLKIEKELKAKELENLKASFEKDIETYRKIMEDEEKRTQIKRKSDADEEAYLRNVYIDEYNEEGRFIKIFNKGKTDIPLYGWVLIEKLDTEERIYKFHKTAILGVNSHILICSCDSGLSHHPPSQLVMKSQTWLKGKKKKALLLNKNGEEICMSKIEEENCGKILKSSAMCDVKTGHFLPGNAEGVPQDPPEASEFQK